MQTFLLLTRMTMILQYHMSHRLAPERPAPRRPIALASYYSLSRREVSFAFWKRAGARVRWRLRKSLFQEKHLVKSLPAPREFQFLTPLDYKK